ncbi:MAG: RusA family crossover junction endodeoxyribonuclease [Betaproteobacteria bacterium]
MSPRKPVPEGARFLCAVPDLPLVLPWSILVPDNHRLIWVYGQARLSGDYRKAKESIGQRARLWWRQPPTEAEVFVWVKLWFPDKRKRDPGNYRKLVTDALTGIVYADDQQAIDERQTRIGFDKDHPRAEVHIILMDQLPEALRAA